MDDKPNKNTTKLLVVAILIVIAYLAFFNFSVQQAYTYTVAQVKAIL